MRDKAVKSVRVGDRIVTVTAYSSITPEDCMEMLLKGSLHQKVTGEQLVEPIPREVKDWIIRSNIVQR